jgi:hypothetical protein
MASTYSNLRTRSFGAQRLDLGLLIAQKNGTTFALLSRATFSTTFFRHKSPSPGAEGICGEKMFPGGASAVPGESAKLSRFESAADNLAPLMEVTSSRQTEGKLPR